MADTCDTKHGTGIHPETSLTKSHEFLVQFGILLLLFKNSFLDAQNSWVLLTAPNTLSSDCKRQGMVVYNKMTKKQTLTQFFYQYLAISKKKRVPRKDLFLPQSWFSEQNNAKGNTSLNSCLQTYHFPLNHDVMGESSGLLRVAIDLHHPKNTSLRKIPIPHCIANPQLQRISEKNRIFLMICS